MNDIGIVPILKTVILVNRQQQEHWRKADLQWEISSWLEIS